MSTPVTIEAGILSPPACYSTDQERFEAFVAAMTAFLSGDFAAPIIQAATPDPADNDKLWVKLNGGTPEYSLGLYLYQDGAWKRAQPLVPAPGTVQWFNGNTDIVLTGVFADDKSAILNLDLDDGDTANPYWRVCDGTNGTPDLMGRVLVGAGSGSGLTTRTFGDTGGEEDHVMTSDESRDHKHGVGADGGNDSVWMKYTGSPATVTAFNGTFFDQMYGTTTRQNNTGNTSTFIETTEKIDLATNPDGHNTMQPFRVLYPIIRTSRLR